MFFTLLLLFVIWGWSRLVFAFLHAKSWRSLQPNPRHPGSCSLSFAGKTSCVCKLRAVLFPSVFFPPVVKKLSVLSEELLPQRLWWGQHGGDSMVPSEGWVGDALASCCKAVLCARTPGSACNAATAWLQSHLQLPQGSWCLSHILKTC